eukprot:CAMPEP_0175039152 /NCGR_PEP_ID=MMETSP0052_2-20121109/363_1 /TAXON_ID=51329 ORGANISM="Polytomella parva, Strain SAG 63-3" /NCGR_SAMPLE_ID=MMETSP0052_2 /ASSEMBLY_ACC=CAM_ASM_000194 /LENGTH=420 /DNA_ID=CAMNT_0016300849 /DNA_START=73 /DNA_END=1336 /DNA_ORIENTATION=+
MADSKDLKTTAPVDNTPELYYYTKNDTLNSHSAQNLFKETSLASLNDGLLMNKCLSKGSGFQGESFFSHLKEVSQAFCNSGYLSEQETLSKQFDELFNPHTSDESIEEKKSKLESELLLLYTPVISSTQEWLKSHAIRVADNSNFKTIVLTAEKQVSGKGRGGNVWSSPAGCLMFSIARTVHLSSIALAPFLNYVTCLAVVQGIRQALPAVLQGQDLGIRIKWPNDIYLNGAKIGGILLNTTWSPNGVMHLITGIGLNVHNRKPTICLEDVVSKILSTEASNFIASKNEGVDKQRLGKEEEIASTQHLRRDVVLAKIVQRLVALMQIFEREGFAPMQDEYLGNWMHSGQKLLFENEIPSIHSNVVQQVELIIQGLTPSGFLLAVNPKTKEQYELSPDGNSLDMMQGLSEEKYPFEMPTYF